MLNGQVGYVPASYLKVLTTMTRTNNLPNSPPPVTRSKVASPVAKIQAPKTTLRSNTPKPVSTPISNPNPSRELSIDEQIDQLTTSLDGLENLSLGGVSKQDHTDEWGAILSLANTPTTAVHCSNPLDLMNLMNQLFCCHRQLPRQI